MTGLLCYCGGALAATVAAVGWTGGLSRAVQWDWSRSGDCGAAEIAGEKSWPSKGSC